MRLDEWQKYIEAQFLDDVETDPEKTIVPVEARVADVVQPDHAALPDAIAETTVRSDDTHAMAKQPERDDDTRSAAEDTPAGPTVPAPAIKTAAAQHGIGDMGEEGRAGISVFSNLDIDIPAFDAYLPSSHRAARHEQVHAPEPTAPPQPAAPLHGALPPVPAYAPEQPVTSPADITPYLAVTTEKDNLTPPSSAVRRAPKSRARHARNVRPDSVPSGLSAGELWAKVPRHVQTLLALERMEEDQEVAQFSYKRPFQEKRHELIERLLDPILSLEDTARLLNVCPTTVRRYTNKGILTYYRKEPDRPIRAGADTHGETDEHNQQSQGKETRQRRFRLSDILAFLETQQAALEADRKAEESAAAGAVRKRRTAAISQSDAAQLDLSGTRQAELKRPLPPVAEKA